MGFEVNIEQKKMGTNNFRSILQACGISFANDIYVHVMLARSRSENRRGKKKLMLIL